MINEILKNKLISGVVVLYNPDSQVVENISSIIDYINYLYLIDNSEEFSSIVQDVFCKNPKVKYVFNNANLGVATAINIAVDKAIKEGYSYLLTMDQDSSFEDGALIKLLSRITDSSSIGIYSPFHKNRYFTKPPINNEPEEVSDVMTSGNVLNLSIIEKVGKFREDYFIDYVDIEYCLRLRKKGYKILRINDAFLNHKEANLEKKKLFGITVYPQNHSAIRWYYKIRNYNYLKKEFIYDFPEYFIYESKNVRNSILKVILFEKNKLQKLRMMIKGYLHFRSNITGKLV